MTDSIDLDDVATDAETEESDDGRNRGDWFWRDEGNPEDEPDDTGAPDERSADGAVGPTDADGTSDAGSDEGSGAAGGRIPRVPRENEDRPVGIPVEGGGAGGMDARRADERDRERTVEPETKVDTDPATADAPSDAPSDAGGAEDAAATASGPHGGGADDMTQAFTYRALKRVEHLHTVLSDAESWTDWVGVVGDVPAHVINKFQRENRVDVDFFNGAGSGPGERLAGVGPSSMFYAERMVLVGLDDEEWMAEEAGWEFVPLSEAAEAAGWELTDPDSASDGDVRDDRPPDRRL